MPANHGVRFHDDERIGPTGPKSPYEDPEQAVGPRDAQPRVLALEHGELLPQGEILEDEVSPRAEGGGDRESEESE